MILTELWSLPTTFKHITTFSLHEQPPNEVSNVIFILQIRTRGPRRVNDVSAIGGKAVRIGYHLLLQFQCSRHCAKHFTEDSYIPCNNPESVKTKNFREVPQFFHVRKNWWGQERLMGLCFPLVWSVVFPSEEVKHRDFKTRTSNPKCYLLHEALPDHHSHQGHVEWNSPTIINYWTLSLCNKHELFC